MPTQVTFSLQEQMLDFGDATAHAVAHSFAIENYLTTSFAPHTRSVTQ